MVSPRSIMVHRGFRSKEARCTRKENIDYPKQHHTPHCWLHVRVMHPVNSTKCFYWLNHSTLLENIQIYVYMYDILNPVISSTPKVDHISSPQLCGNMNSANNLRCLTIQSTSSCLLLCSLPPPASSMSFSAFLSLIFHFKLLPSRRDHHPSAKDGYANAHCSPQPSDLLFQSSPTSASSPWLFSILELHSTHHISLCARKSILILF